MRRYLRGKTFEKNFEPFAGGRRNGLEMMQDFVVALDVKALVRGAKHVIGGPDVQLPDIFGLPRRKRFGVHRFDICVGEQAEHFQAFRRFNFFGELADSSWVENVAAERGAQLHMTIDQEKHCFPVRRIEFEPVETGAGNLHAGHNMVIAVNGLACIVEEQRKVEQVGLLEFIEQLGIALVPGRMACRNL